MAKAIALLLAFGMQVALPVVGQLAQPNEFPQCPASADNPRNSPDNMIRPKYPKGALRNGASGAVELRAVISPAGELKDLTVLRGESEFSKAAVEAVRRWRFRPEMREGQPVETNFKISVRFNFLLREANADVALESPQAEPLRTGPAWTRHLDFGLDVHRLSEPGMIAPRQIYAPEPEFSEASRKQGEQGTVGIALVVGSDGLPRDLRVVCSSIPDSTENAVEAVKQWKFAPATKDGEPVAVAIVVGVSFMLNAQ